MMTAEQIEARILECHEGCVFTWIADDACFAYDNFDDSIHVIAIRDEKAYVYDLCAKIEEVIDL